MNVTFNTERPSDEFCHLDAATAGELLDALQYLVKKYGREIPIFSTADWDDVNCVTYVADCYGKGPALEISH